MEFELKLKCGYVHCYEPSVKIEGCCSIKCKYKVNQLQKAEKIKSQAIQYMGGKCVKCNFGELESSLVFHHVDPFDKKFEISKQIHKGFRYLQSELDKCVLLCKNCHDVVHSTKDPRFFNFNRYCFGTNPTNFETVKSNMGYAKCTTDFKEKVNGRLYKNPNKLNLIPSDTIIHS